MKFKVVAVLLALFLAYLLAYTFTVYSVVDNLCLENGRLWWRTTPPGSLFPIPHGSGMLQVLSQPSQLDEVIYFNLIRNNLLIGIDFLVAIILALTLIFGRKFI